MLDDAATTVEPMQLGDGIAYLHRPDGRVGGGLALTHGAGGNCAAPLLQSTAAEWVARGFAVLRFDLPFRVRKAKGPPHPSRAAEDRDGIADAVDTLRSLVSAPIILGGHSYGGRQASMIASETPGLVDGLIVMSYPLHPVKKPDKLRTDHFPALGTPTLFVHGTKDPFGTIADIDSAAALIPVRTALTVIDGAGHDLSAPRYETASRTADAAATLFDLNRVVPTVVQH